MSSILDELYLFGYVGVFGLSLLSSLIVFVPIPYLAIILVASLSGRFDPVLLVISSSIGSAIAKLVIFQACYSGQKLVPEKIKLNLAAFQRIFSKYALLAVFIAASTPIPDDLVYVPLGFSRYNRVKFFASTLAGKIVLVSVIVYGGAFLNSSILVFFAGEGQLQTEVIWIIGLAVAAVTILLTYMIGKIDWTKWMEERPKSEQDE